MSRLKPFFAGGPWMALVRLSGEIAVVTVGILIAFALEAWWQDRAAAEQEQVHLRALASDLQTNIDDLLAMIDSGESVMASSQELLKLSQLQNPGPTESLDELFSAVFNSRRYEPVMGAYEALVNSGGLAVIRDETLRAALAEFAATVSGRYAETWSDEQYFSFSREYAGRIALLHARHPPVQVRQGAYEEMLRNSRFQEHLTLRYYSERDVANKYGGLVEQAEALLAQIRSQLRDQG